MANYITIDILSPSTGIAYSTSASVDGIQLNPITYQTPSSGQWYYTKMYPYYETEGGTGVEYTIKITINTNGTYYFFLSGAGGYGGNPAGGGGGQCGGGGSGQGMAYNNGLYLCEGSTIYVVLPSSNNVNINNTQIYSNMVINAISPGGFYTGELLYYTLSCTAGSGGDGVSIENGSPNGTDGGNGGSGNTFVATTSTSNGGTIETAPPIVIPGAGGNGGLGASPGHAGAVGGGSGSITGGSNIVGPYNPPSIQNIPNWANFTFADGTTSTQAYPLLLAGGQNEGAGLAAFMIYYNALA